MTYRSVYLFIAACVACLITCLTPYNCIAQNTPRRALLALSKADHILAIIDPVTFKVMARIPVGPDPHEVVASTDGNFAYVSNMGGGNLHELDVIDLTAQTALPNFNTGPLIGLHGLDYKNGKLWFTAEGAKAIGRYDPKTATVDWIMGTGQNRTHMIHVTSDEKQIYTTNVESGTVSIFESVVMTPMPPPGGGMPQGGMPPRGGTPPPGMQPHAQWMQTLIPVSRGSEGFDVSPDGRELWTAAADDGKVSVIDIGSKKLATTIDAQATGANRLQFTPDGKRVFISSLRTGDLFIYDASTRREITRMNVGHGAAGILMDPDGERAFVACTGDNDIVVIDLKTLKITGHIDLGGPDGMAWAKKP